MDLTGWIWRCCFIHGDVSLSRSLPSALVHSAQGRVCDTVLDPMGTYFGLLFPGHKGIILILSHSQSWRLQFRTWMDFVRVFHNLKAGISRALRPFPSSGQCLWPLCMNKGSTTFLIYCLQLTWNFEDKTTLPVVVRRSNTHQVEVC